MSSLCTCYTYVKDKGRLDGTFRLFLVAGKAKAVGYETKREEDGMASNSKKKMNVKPR